MENVGEKTEVEAVEPEKAMTMEEAEAAATEEAGVIYEQICADIGGGVLKLFALSLNREAVRGTLNHIHEVAHDRWTRRDTIINAGKGIITDLSNAPLEFEVNPDLKYNDGAKITSNGMPYRFDAKKNMMVRDV